MENEFKWTDTFLKEWTANAVNKNINPDMFGGWAGYKKELEDFKNKKSKELSKEKDYQVIDGGSIGGKEIIVTVKRVKDGEVFTLNDNTDEGVIRKFYIEDNIVWVGFEEKGGVCNLYEIEKINK